MKTKAVRSRAERLVHMMKERCSRSGRTAGFTLVELIVVIAILAILAGVGTVAYSGYVKKANQAVDIQLAGDVKYALELAAVSPNSDLGAGVGVVITMDGVQYKKIDGSAWVDDTEDTSAAKQAVIAAFGDDSALKLSYDGWTNTAGSVYAEYSQSSFAGTEADLLSDIQQLTDAFETFTDMNGNLESYAGANFVNFLSGNGIDSGNTQQVANSAALYVADRTVDVNEDSYVAVWADANSNLTPFLNLQTGDITLGTMGGLASLYARGEALVKYLDQQKANDGASTALTVDGDAYSSMSAWFSSQEITGRDTNAVIDNVSALYNKTTSLAVGPAYVADTLRYFGINDFSDPVNTTTSQAAQDAKAYLQTMKALQEAAPVLSENLDSDTLYTDSNTVRLVTGYINLGGVLEGTTGSAIGVMAVRQADGSYQVASYPIDYVS